MKVLVNNAIQTLDYIVDGVNHAEEFAVGLDWSEEHNAYVADQETYDYWVEMIGLQQQVNTLAAELSEEHGLDVVEQALADVGDNADLEADLRGQLAALTELSI
jgi:hypothetical protein